MTLQYVILMEILSAFRIYAISKDPTPNKVHRTLQVTFGRFSDFKWRTVYVSSKLAYGGGRGGQKLAKSCLRSLWMVPIVANTRSAAKIRKNQ